MQSHCQHNLYICHCTPGSQDPSPIHPLQTTTLHRFPAKKASNGNGNVSKDMPGNGELKKHGHPVYVSHSSVAVMTSPTLHITHNKSSVDQLTHQLKAQQLTTAVDHVVASSPSTSSSCSSLPTTTVMTNNHLTMTSAAPGNGHHRQLTSSTSGGTLNRFSQHLVSLPAPPESGRKYFGCYGRSCIERLIFILMVVLMVGVFLVAGLLCLHIGSGGLKRLSNLIFDHQTGGYDGPVGPDIHGGFSVQQPLQPELVDLMDEGIDVVRIRTTEEVG